jgi:hypothetical protein
MEFVSVILDFLERFAATNQRVFVETEILVQGTEIV